MAHVARVPWPPTIRGRSRSLDKLLMQLHSTSLQLLTPLRKLLLQLLTGTLVMVDLTLGKLVLPLLPPRVGTLLLPMRPLLGVPQLTPPQDVSWQRACWSVRELL